MTTVVTCFDVCDECKSDTGALWSLGIELGDKMLCRPCYEHTLEDIDCGSNYHTLCDSMKCRRCYDKSLASCEKAFSVDSSEISRLKLKLPRFVFKKSGKGYPFICEVGHRWMMRPLKLNGANRWCPDPKCIKKRKTQTCMANNGVEYPFQSEEIRKKSEQTCTKKYGVKNCMQSAEVRETFKQTCIANHGVDNPMKSEVIKAKSRATCMEKYGSEFVFQVAEIRAKGVQTWIVNYGFDHPMKSDDVKEKVKATTMANYGVENSMQSEIVKQKARATCLEHFGTEHYMQSEEYRRNCLEKYGTEHLMKSEEIKERGVQTCLRKYGVKYPTQCPEIYSKAQQSAFQSKEYIFPSGRETEVQGYEDIAIDNLLEIYEEDDIQTWAENHLIITYYIDDEKHVYYPDILIESENMIVEVKSTYTYEIAKERNELKARACIEQGYKFQFYIIDKKFSIDVQDRE